MCIWGVVIGTTVHDKTPAKLSGGLGLQGSGCRAFRVQAVELSKLSAEEASVRDLVVYAILTISLIQIRMGLLVAATLVSLVQLCFTRRENLS